MKEFTYVIKDPAGVHARPAGLIVKEAKNFNSDIILKHGIETANLKRLLSIMSLGIAAGDVVTVVCSGEDENEACIALEKLLQENL